MPDGMSTAPVKETAIRGIGLLAKALAAAQGAIRNASKEAENPGFKRDGKPMKYADLTAVWDACRAALSQNEIAVIQAPAYYEDGTVVLHTTLVHSSGDQITGTYPVKPVQQTPQGYGSALTYARRYSMASMVGVAPEGDDDDGNAGSARNVSAPCDPTAGPHPTDGPMAKTRPAPEPEPPSQPKRELTPEQQAAARDYKTIAADLKAARTVDDVDKIMAVHAGPLKSIKAVSAEGYQKLADAADARRRELGGKEG